MDKIKNIIKLLLGKRHLVQASNYKLALYKQEQCERTLQMHLYTLKKRDFTLIVILTVALSAFWFMLASLWPPVRDINSKTTLIVFPPASKPTKNPAQESILLDKRNFPKLDLANIDEKNEQNVKHVIKLHPKITNFMTTSSIYCLNNNIFISVKLNVKFKQSTSAITMMRELQGQLSNFNITYELAWSLVPLKGSKKFAGLTNSNMTTREQVIGGDNSLRIVSNCKYDPIRSKPTGRSWTLLNCVQPNLLIEQKILQPKKRRFLLMVNVSNIEIILCKNPFNSLLSIEIDSIGVNTQLDYMSSIFRALIVFTHMIFYCITIWLAFWFFACLNEHSYIIWSIEQTFTAILFVLLICTNSPLSLFDAISFDCNSNSANLNDRIDIMTGSDGVRRVKFGIIESIFNSSFLCCLLMNWLVFGHSLRQMIRPFWSFYAPKLFLVGSIWLLILVAILSQNNYLSPNSITINLHVLFYLLLLIYFVSLLQSHILTYTELQSVSFLRLRMKVQSILCIWILLNYLLTIKQEPYSAQTLTGSEEIDDKYDNQTVESRADWSILGVTELSSKEAKLTKESKRHSQDAILSLLPYQHSFDSANLFLNYVLLNNVYVMVSAYLYWPVSPRTAGMDIYDLRQP